MTLSLHIVLKLKHCIIMRLSLLIQLYCNSWDCSCPHPTALTYMICISKLKFISLNLVITLCLNVHCNGGCSQCRTTRKTRLCADISISASLCHTHTHTHTHTCTNLCTNVFSANGSCSRLKVSCECLWEKTVSTWTKRQNHNAALCVCVCVCVRVCERERGRETW